MIIKQISNDNPDDFNKIIKYQHIVKIILFFIKKMKNSQIAGSFTKTRTFDDDLPRTVTKNSITVSSSEQLKKVIRELEKSLRQEVQKRKQAQDTLLYYRKRIVNRQNQFRVILEKVGYNKIPITNKTIDQLYNTILQNFDQTNQKSLQVLQKKLKHNSANLQRRIAEISEKAEQQLAKNRKISASTFQMIKSELEQTRDLALEIDKQNEQFRTKNNNLQFQLKILMEERNTILQQLLSKKKMLSKAITQLAEIKKNNSIEEAKNSFKQIQLEEKNKTVEADMLFQDISMPSTLKRNVIGKKSSHSNTRNCTSLNNSTISFYPTKYGNKNTQNISNYRKNSCLRKNQKTMNEFRTLQSNQIKKLTIQTNPQIAKSFTSMQNTIKHLQLALQRERKKKTQYGNLVAQLTFRNSQINNVLEQCLLNSKEGQENKKVPKNQKLFQAIKDIKKRLKMIQPPTVNCGWGDDQQQIKKLIIDDMQ